MKEQEIRNSFIEFFKEKGHTVVPSALLTPDDPTVLFTIAGMVQFKKLWTGSEVAPLASDSGEVPLPYKRAVSIQKCLRANDLADVGKKVRYHTFFEMLGNFSFGDYFKEEAIQWGWEYLTKIVKLPAEKLYISVLKGDDESYKIWQKIVGKAGSTCGKKIYELGEENNFWKPVGSSGACGPCSEIYYDLGKESGCGNPDCKPGCDCDRFIEIWNLVFPQYDSQPDGSLKPLKNRGVDTGMGFERLCMVAQNKNSPFELELFQPIIREAELLCNLKYKDEKVFFNIVADHIRALVFSIAEGIYPSNIGRGYVLRHILRRVQTLAYEKGIKEPFLYKVVPVVIDIMKEAYPENIKHREGIALVIKSEEESFLRTVEQGTKIFYSTLAELKTKTIPGEVIFKLYDTYGFPPDLTYELAQQKGKVPDKEGFEKVMEQAREKAKSSSKFTSLEQKGVWNEFSHITTTKFTGYKQLKTTARISRWRQVAPVAEIDKDKIELVLDKTPFYGESGGQVGDKGKIYNDDFEFEVLDTYKMEGLTVHSGKIIKGEISKSSRQGGTPTVICEVNNARRKAIARNHTATHLLHSALRKVLGEWVHQQGSSVEAEQFRFDFTHFNPLTPHELETIESLINRWIEEDIEMNIFETTFEEAVKMGAMALFGEKYGKKVRVIKIGDVSTELCGGTHLSSTGDIKIIKILSEGSIHAGVRRITAITGTSAFVYLKEKEEQLKLIAEKLGVSMPEAGKKVEELIEREQKSKVQLSKLERSSLSNLIPEIIANKKEVNGIEVLISEVPTDNEENLRNLSDKLRVGMMRVGVIGAVINSKPFFITFVSDDLKEKLKASDIAKEIGKIAGGGGGGKPFIGQAGGKAGVSISSILVQVPEIIKKLNA